ncbi:topless-related protein 1-like isoform X1 [Iris pallida]|uniref:Topless-related protein 1-like isoform X1 n=1 Tax=Iris pallida TaxID=29817 RepID=A0AAX6EG02_IRIPA|nr:topless-related protein 1-like isoform X1 [Iris pallida]
MTSLCRELVFLILQFLDEEKFKETVHKLEQESGFYFNMKHFEESVLAGDWDEVEKYLSGFTKVDDNRYSMKIFFEIRKQKYLEALDKRDRSRAVEILLKDLKVFSAFNEDLFKEITQLITLENFRENEQLSKYGDTKSARGIMLTELKKLIEANPMFRDKLQFPTLKSSRLRALINQSLNWQHNLCKNPRQNPDIKTLFYDHSCHQANGAQVPSSTPSLMNAMPMHGGFPQMAPQRPFQPPAASLLPSLSGWMTSVSNPAQMAHPVVSGAVSGAPLGLAAPSTANLLKRPMTPSNSNPVVDYHSAESEHVLKRTRPMGISDEAGVSTSNLPVGYPGFPRNQYSTEELPKNVAVVLNQGSSITSMDFHPSQPTVLLVGTNVGDIAIWEVSSRQRLGHRNFKVWDLQACSMLLQSALAKDPAISVNRVLWNPDGSQFGVAYSKHLVQLYSYNGREDLNHHLEIDAHVGGVNDIAFSQPSKRFCVVTCGDDKTIKVWDAVNGVLQYTFEGHETAVYSICPHVKENIQFIFSTSLDGKIKAWLYDNGGPRVDYTAPGHSCTTMAYSADGTRLFSCGTSKEGESYIVEWNESEGSVKRTFTGFRKRSVGVVQFDTTKNRFLAAGDEFVVKFWDMDNTNLLTTADAEGGLPASPRIRFNKLGSLLAVSTSDNCIKVLANADGFQMLRSLENQYNSAPRSVSEAITKASAISPLGSSNAIAGTSVTVSERSAPVTSIVGLQNVDTRSLIDVKPRLDESIEKSKIWKLAEISEPSQCCSLKLPDNLLALKVSRLIYTNSGMAILALASNAVHKLWKWQKTDRHTGKATTSVPPQLWQPSSGILMTNEITDVNPEEAVHCFALSKNDSYVMSASGGKISLFNMMTFKTMTTFMPPPPAATFLAFHPQDNNIIAIGMDDSSIQIYNVRVDEVKSKLRGHQKRITGLAFSNILNALVSSGADAQLCVWGMDGWDKQSSKFLQIPAGRVSGSLAETRVQFHHDQVTFLVVHETQLAMYEASKLECLKQWIPREGSITHGTYSCDSRTVYTSFTDGSIGIFTSALLFRCRINPSAYINSQPSSNVYPVVVASHPTEPNQFAVGLTDGSVQVLEPLESEKKWGTDPPPESASGGNASSSQPSGNPSSEQPSR